MRSSADSRCDAMHRRQWIQDSRAHVGQVLQSLEHADRGLPGLSAGVEPGLRSEVSIVQEQQVLALEQQDLALDRIEKAAQRVGHLGLEIHRELGVCCQPLLRSEWAACGLLATSANNLIASIWIEQGLRFQIGMKCVAVLQHSYA
jgi:hypothetical protein